MGPFRKATLNKLVIGSQECDTEVIVQAAACTALVHRQVH